MHAIRTTKESNSVQRDAGRLLAMMSRIVTIRDPQYLTQCFVRVRCGPASEGWYTCQRGKLQAGLTSGESWGKLPKVVRLQGNKSGQQIYPQGVGVPASGREHPSAPPIAAKKRLTGIYSALFPPPLFAPHPLLIIIFKSQSIKMADEQT